MTHFRLTTQTFNRAAQRVALEDREYRSAQEALSAFRIAASNPNTLSAHVFQFGDHGLACKRLAAYED